MLGTGTWLALGAIIQLVKQLPAGRRPIPDVVLWNRASRQGGGHELCTTKVIIHLFTPRLLPFYNRMEAQRAEISGSGLAFGLLPAAVSGTLLLSNRMLPRVPSAAD